MVAVTVAPKMGRTRIKIWFKGVKMRMANPIPALEKRFIPFASGFLAVLMGLTMSASPAFAAGDESSAPQEDSSQSEEWIESGQTRKKVSSSEEPVLNVRIVDDEDSGEVASAKVGAKSGSGSTKAALKISAPTKLKSGGGYDSMLEWKKKNSDVMGWLTVPGTNIDYAVVQGPTNDYYLEKGYDKQYSYNGVIWADQDVTASSKNTILYGHNWTNYSATPRIGNPSDVMFGQLTSYHYLDFAKEHPVIEYADKNGNANWAIFAAFYTDLHFDYIKTDANVVSLAKEAMSRSMHNFSVDVKSSDKILTLSTCTRAYGKRADQRFVVMARKVRKGEKLTVNATENVNFKKPQF